MGGKWGYHATIFESKEQNLYQLRINTHKLLKHFDDGKQAIVWSKF